MNDAAAATIAPVSWVARGVGLAAAWALLLTTVFAAVAPSGPAPAEPSGMLGAALAVALLHAAVLAGIAARLRGADVQASLALFAISFGAMSLLSQVESIYFVDEMPTGDALRVMLAGALALGLYCPLVVRAVRPWRARIAGAEPMPLPATARAWAPRLAAVAALYLVLYLGFGYFVAWQDPGLRAFYGARDPQGFAPHLAQLVRDDPRLLPFQVLRAGLWLACALPVLRGFQGGVVACGIAVGLAFAVLMNAQLLLPNPYMPEAVRHVHLAETAPSNFLFGLGLVAIVRAGRAQPA